MSQFVGLLRKNPTDGRLGSAVHFGQVEAVLCKALSARAGGATPGEARSGRFWCASITVLLTGFDACQVRPDGVVGAVAGDPLVIADANDDVAPSAYRSAVEVINALAAGAADALHRSHGSFAAVAWNPRDDAVMLATDKLGIRPVYYKEEADRFVFSTSVRLLRAASGEPLRVDEQGFAELLFLSQPLGARTVLDGVRLLRPGESLRFHPSSGVHLNRYFSLADVPPAQLTREQAQIELHAVFTRAVRRRLITGEQEAFLSGGMDSRSVVAELIDQEQRVSTFSASYPGSLDDVVAEVVAEKLGTRHVTWRRNPADQISKSGVSFAHFAAEHFDSPRRGSLRPIWSGDGGSVMLGHVYLDESRTVLAAQPPTADTMRRLAPAIGGRRTRHLSLARQRELGDLAIQGMIEEFRTYEAAPPDRRLFLYFASNDQARHLHHHFDVIETSKVEFLTPFFDAELVSLVMSLPVTWFLRHAFYNDWIKGFECGAGDIFWQSYPGHLPCPHPPLAGEGSDQWDARWFRSHDARRRFRALAAQLVHIDSDLARPFLRPLLLHAAGLLNVVGSTRLNHEISVAQRIVDELG